MTATAASAAAATSAQAATATVQRPVNQRLSILKDALELYSGWLSEMEAGQVKVEDAPVNLRDGQLRLHTILSLRELVDDLTREIAEEETKLAAQQSLPAQPGGKGLRNLALEMYARAKVQFDQMLAFIKSLENLGDEGWWKTNWVKVVLFVTRWGYRVIFFTAVLRFFGVPVPIVMWITDPLFSFAMEKIFAPALGNMIAARLMYLVFFLAGFWSTTNIDKVVRWFKTGARW